ncbi:MAG: hypothetical protein OXN85_11505, partial [Gemmatimonadetes bacterium]|nr:hypothetical protein [Candidatus Palauibacter australiensis]
ADHFGLVPSEGLLADPFGVVDISAPGGRNAAVDVSGFDRAVFERNLLGGRYPFEGDSLTFEAAADSLGTTIRLGGDALATVSFAELIARAGRSGTTTAPGRVQLPPDSLRLDVSGADVTARIQVTLLRLHDSDGELRPTRVTGTLLLGPADDPPP